YATLQDMQIGTGSEVNSINVDPLYASITDLHVSQVALNATATPVGVTIDIDGQTRAITPDIGADEFTVPDNDAQPVEILTPGNPTCLTSAPVTISILNAGILNLVSSTINWSINSVAQTPFAWTGNLPSGSVDTVAISSGSITFTEGDFIKVWTTLPNGVV